MPGAAHLRDSLVLQKLTQIHAQENRPYAAICAAPAVTFESWGLLTGLQVGAFFDLLVLCFIWREDALY